MVYLIYWFLKSSFSTICCSWYTGFFCQVLQLFVGVALAKHKNVFDRKFCRMVVYGKDLISSPVLYCLALPIFQMNHFLSVTLHLQHWTQNKNFKFLRAGDYLCNSVDDQNLFIFNLLWIIIYFMKVTEDQANWN